MYGGKAGKALLDIGIRVGDRIKVTSGEGSFEGVLMPKPDSGEKDAIVIKLKNGYNIGIKFTEDMKIMKVGSAESFSFPRSSMKFGKGLPKIGLVYTGGTIGSKIDYMTGGVHMLTKPEELLYEVGELTEIAEVHVDDLMSVASEDISHVEWAMIAKAVADAFEEGARGVVITHGTDTMHYTSAALSFMLSDLQGPVVLTGAQRSSDRGSSDAFMNLICAASLAARSEIAEVGIAMHMDTSDKYCGFIRGTKARKMHTSARDAFRPINNRFIARIGYSGNIEYLDGYKKAGKGARTKATVKFEPRIAMVKTYPNSDPGILDYHIGKGVKGIIIEGTGLGHAPVSTKHKEYNWMDAMKRAVDAGCLLGITSQCINGRVNGSVYRNARIIADAGAVYCEDMLTEVAYVKLGFLLAHHRKEEAARLLRVNMAGEITDRTETGWVDGAFDAQ